MRNEISNEKSFFFCSLVSFSTPYFNKSKSFRVIFISRHLPCLCLKLSTLSFSKKEFLIYIYIYIFASAVADAFVINQTGIKTPLANGLSRSFIKGNPFFVNYPRSLPKAPRDCIILDSQVFEILVDELFAKAPGSFKTCLFKNLFRKIVSSS